MSAAGAGQHPLRILIADDDADQRFILRRLFARAGFEDVVEASDGVDVVPVAAAERPDLVVLDLAMPGRSGVEVLPDLQALLPGVPIVVVSNFPRERLSAVVRARGAVGYVEKGVGPERIVDEILIAAALAEGAASHVTGRFSAEHSAPREARRLARDFLGAADEELVGTVELLVSELVTNAVVHASSAPVVDIHVSGRVVRVEVHDEDPHLPQPRVPDEDSPGGRGLLLLDQLASHWGARPSGGGKVVWFEVARSPG